jgi:hypothetical protein
MGSIEFGAKVLVLGVFDLSSTPCTAVHMIRTLADSIGFRVEQRWVQLGPPLPPPYSNVTWAVGHRGTHFFEHLNGLMDEEGVDPWAFDVLVIANDDADLPPMFLDQILPVMEAYSFDAAQGARPPGSYVAHRNHYRRPGARARLVRMIESGPVSIYTRNAFEVLLCEAGRFPTGIRWGFDVRLAQRAKERGLRLGIVDCVPVGHVRPYNRDPNYHRWRKEFQDQVYAGKVEILPPDEWNETLEVYA